MPIDRTVGNYFDHSGSFVRRVARLTGPASYAAGGEALTPAALGMGTLVVVLLSPATNAAGSAVHTVVWNAATQKVQWFDAAGVEITAEVNLSTFSAGFEAIGQ
jgi:hypothetical protein